MIPINKYFFFLILSSQILFSAEDCKKNYSLDDFRNFFGICWTDNPTEALQYAKNVGHKHIMYIDGMENNPLSEGMYFYLETPEHYAYNRTLYFTKKYSESEIHEIENLCTIIYPEKKFPNNLATGWFWTKNRCSMQLDFQQKKVHNVVLDRVFALIERIQSKRNNFKFGGFAWDVPQPYGDYNYTTETRLNNQTTLAHWTGKDSIPVRKGITIDYETHFNGHFEFYRAIMEKARTLNPKAKFIVEPYFIESQWTTYYHSDFIKSKSEEDAKKYMPDWILEEGHSLDFCENDAVLKKYNLTPAETGSSTPDVFDEKTSRNIAAHAAIKGSWTTWYGRFGGSGNAPSFKSIRDVPARIKLAKLIAVWENLNNTPLSERKYDGTVYSSPTAYMSPNIYWAIKPKTNLMYIVFINGDSELQLPNKWRVKTRKHPKWETWSYGESEIYHLDGLFDHSKKIRQNIVIVKDNIIKLSGPEYSNMGFVAVLKKAENNK